MPASRVTLKDIAGRTGYTVNTVSRALRGDEKLSENTRKTIQKAADELGYIRNNFASTLRSGTSHLIAIIVNDIRSTHYAYLISEIERYLRGEGYDILVLSTTKEGDENVSGSHIVSVAVMQSVDGILYFPYQHDHASIDFMKRSGIPFVLVERKIDNVTADVVRCDDYEGGRLAAEHFLSLGHRRFLYVQGPAYSSSQTEREKGFTETLRAHGVPEQDIFYFPDADLEQRSGMERLTQMLKREQITAALVFRDEMAYLMMNQLYSRGFRVPRDLSIIGFDHLYGYSPFMQPLTSVFCPSEYSLGRTTAELLLKKIRDPSAQTQEIVFPVRIYQEGTTGEA